MTPPAAGRDPHQDGDDAGSILTVYQGSSGIAVAGDLGYLHVLGSGDAADEGRDRDAEIEAATGRIAADAAQPGFLAVTVSVGARLCGFGTALAVPSSFARDPLYLDAAEQWGAAQAADCLAGALRIRDLVVAPQARGLGLGARILDRLTTTAADGRVWVRVPGEARLAGRFFRSRGWQQAFRQPADRLTRPTVLVAPHHPVLAGLPS